MGSCSRPRRRPCWPSPGTRSGSAARSASPWCCIPGVLHTWGAACLGCCIPGARTWDSTSMSTAWSPPVAWRPTPTAGVRPGSAFSGLVRQVSRRPRPGPPARRAQLRRHDGAGTSSPVAQSSSHNPRRSPAPRRASKRSCAGSPAVTSALARTAARDASRPSRSSSPGPHTSPRHRHDPERRRSDNHPTSNRSPPATAALDPKLAMAPIPDAASLQISDRHARHPAPHPTPLSANAPRQALNPAIRRQHRHSIPKSRRRPAAQCYEPYEPLRNS